MNHARCQCGAVAVSLSAPCKLVVACHCVDCQRRTGAPFGVGAFYADEYVAVSGAPKEFVRDAESGGSVSAFFCSICGSTVFWRAANLPGFVGVAIGAIEDAKDLAPARSIFERSKHGWVEICGAGVEHYPQSSLPKAQTAASSY